MTSYKEDIEHMSLMRSSIDGSFSQYSRGTFVNQLCLFGMYYVCMATSVIKGDYDIHTSFISSCVGALMLFILQVYYEIPQFRKYGMKYFSAGNINDLLLFVISVAVCWLRYGLYTA